MTKIQILGLSCLIVGVGITMFFPMGCACVNEIKDKQEQQDKGNMLMISFGLGMVLLLISVVILDVMYPVTPH